MTRAGTKERLFDRHRALGLLRDAGLDAVVALLPPSVTLITGYGAWLGEKVRGWMLEPQGGAAPSPGAAIYTADDAVVAVIPDILAAEASGTTEATVVGADWPRLYTSAVDALTEVGLATARLGVELDGGPPALRSTLGQMLPGARVVDCSTLLRLVRMWKTPAAISRLREAATVTEAALQDAVAMHDPGQPLSELRRAFRLAVARHDADLDHVAYGLRAGGVGTGEAAETIAGRPVFLDVGARWRHFYSDTGLTVTATEVTRGAISPLRRASEAVAAGASACRPAARCSTVYSAMRRVLQPDDRLRAKGHGLGLEVREYPVVAPEFAGVVSDECLIRDADMELEDGMVVNLEVGGFFDDGSSVQNEQTFIVRENGVEPLISYRRNEPWQLGVPELRPHVRYSTRR
jgi:Xaa-Pro dipeptidase